MKQVDGAVHALTCVFTALQNSVVDLGKLGDQLEDWLRRRAT